MSSDTAPPAPTGEAPQRRRLQLKPRDPDAAARLDAERQAHLNKSNPFGAAKPREAVIAEKLGKTEEEVLKEEVSKEKLHLRLSGAQLDEKRQLETGIKDAEEALALEEDEGRKAELAADLAARQKTLDDLMETFAKATLETALSGGAPRVSQIRQQQQLEQGVQPGMGGAYGAPGGGFPGGGRGGGGQYGQPGGYPAAAGGGSFGGREFNEPRAGPGGAPAGGASRGFRNYQDRPAGGGGGGFSATYQERGGGGGRRGGAQRLPEWALDDASGEGGEAGFYDAPAATSAFIASGGYQGGGGGGGGYQGGGAGGGGYSDYGSGGGGGRGGGGRGGRGGGRGGGRSSYGNGGYDAGYGAPAGRGVGGEFEFSEDPSSFGAGQDRF